MKSIEVRVRPNAKQPGLEELEDGTWIAWTKSPPIDGRANRELVELVARHFGVAKTKVIIRRGVASRRKLLEIEL